MAAPGPWQTRFFERGKSPKTAEKHRALERAFLGWLARAPADDAPHVVFDGYAGAGRFATVAGDDSDEAALGSPLLFLTWAARAPQRRVRCVFAEKNAEHAARLSAAVDQRFAAQRAEEPRLVQHVDVRHATCEVVAAELLGALSPDSRLFSFLDPYNWEGLRLATTLALAARGDVVLHLASGAIAEKLRSKNGEGAAEARRMDLVLGATPGWAALRSFARGRATSEIAADLAECVAAGLSSLGGPLAVVSAIGSDSHLVVRTV